jgi:hypothetical protein
MNDSRKTRNKNSDYLSTLADGARIASERLFR